MEAKEEEIVDTMSALPDELLCNILSFLPSKCSIRTSSLSTRFRYLWRSVPALEFGDVCDSRYFGEITNYALNNHTSLEIIRRFRLSLGEFSYCTSAISGFIDLCIAASYSNLEVLHVHIPLGNFIFLSPKIFSGRKLKSICLSGRICIEIPVDVCASFPCLENLTFKSVSIKSGNLLSKFLTGCPRLKTCDIIDCELVIPLQIFSSCRKLKSISLSGKIVIEIPVDVYLSFPCLEDFTFRSLSMKGGSTTLIELISVCPRLKTCDIIDCNLSNEFPVLGRPDTDTIKKLHLEYHVRDGDSVSPQASASIDISSSTSNSKVAFDLLKYVSNITKHLEICKPKNIGFKNGGVIVWQNLTHLVVKMLWCSSPALSLLLEHSPNLISLVLEKDHFWDMLKVELPNIWYHKLEIVKIIGWIRFEESEIVQYFLKNALVLKKLVLCYNVLTEQIKDAKRAIDEAPRASTHCKVELLKTRPI